MNAAFEREVNAIYASVERSPREFARALDGQFQYAFLGLTEQNKERARFAEYLDGLDLKARIADFEACITVDTEALTSAWVLWGKWHRNDAELTGNERNLAKRWARLVQATKPQVSMRAAKVLRHLLHAEGA